MALSKRQAGMLAFIRTFVDEHQFPPTIREIGKAVGITSTSVVNYNLNVLEDKGHIARDRNVSRGLRLLDAEIESVQAASEARARDASQGLRLVREGARGSPRVLNIPLLGRIAAGKPITIPEEVGDFAPFGDDTVEVAASMLEEAEGLYALEVRGQSMIDALINDGDIVVMKHQNHAETGEMVAVLLVDENETTLKRFYLEGDRVRLQPANPTMQPIYAPAADVEIQGKVMMVIRKLD